MNDRLTSEYLYLYGQLYVAWFVAVWEETSPRYVKKKRAKKPDTTE